MIDDERYNVIIIKWVVIKDDIERDFKKLIKFYLDNLLFMMFNFGVCGNLSNFV